MIDTAVIVPFDNVTVTPKGSRSPGTAYVTLAEKLPSLYPDVLVGGGGGGGGGAGDPLDPVLPVDVVPPPELF